MNSQKTTSKKMRIIAENDKQHNLQKMRSIGEKQYSCNDETAKSIYRQLVEENKINDQHTRELSAINKTYKEQEQQMRIKVYKDERIKRQPDFDKLNSQSNDLSKAELSVDSKIQEIDEKLLHDKLKPEERLALENRRTTFHQSKLDIKEQKMEIERKKVNLNEQIIKTSEDRASRSY